MSKLVKFFAIAALVAGAFAMTPGPAAAQHHHHHHAAATGTVVLVGSDGALASVSARA